MIKKLFLLLFVAALFTACNNAPSTEGEKVSAEAEVATLTVDNLLTDIDKLVGQEVVIVGTVDHVCKHGGGKLVIYTASPENGLHVMATDESGKFRADEVGDELIEVKGTVDEFRVDESYIVEKEAKLADMIAENGGETEAEEATEEEGEHHGGGDFPDTDGKHKQEIEGLQNQIASLKAQLEELKAEGKDHISYYSVKCATYKVLEQEDKEDVEAEIPVEKAAEATTEEAPATTTDEASAE